MGSLGCLGSAIGLRFFDWVGEILRTALSHQVCADCEPVCILEVKLSGKGSRVSP